MADLFDLPWSILFSRLFTFRPKVVWDGKLFVAKSDWKSQVFCFGYSGRKVVVDPISKIVRIRRRIAWCFYHSRSIGFDQINEVNYTYKDLSPESPMWPITAYQQLDLFSVGLDLKSGEYVLLFRFYGEGSLVNDSFLPDWCYFLDNIEAKLSKQNQEGESLSYVDVLSLLIGVPISNTE